MRGSIRKRGRNSWELKFDVPGDTRRTRYVTVRGSYKDAQRKLTELLNAADHGTLPEPTRMTVGEYLRAWLASAHKQSPKTLERYRELAELQIIPHLGHHPLQKLHPLHLQAWHHELHKTLSNRSIQHAHRLLSVALSNAVRVGALSHNVATVVRPPAAISPEIEMLSPTQVTGLLGALKGHSLYPLIALAIGTGARRGELVGLQWGDFEGCQLRIQRSVEETRKLGRQLKGPKTRYGKRTITLADETVAVLSAYKVKQLELRLMLGLGKIEPSTLMFSTIEGGLLSPNNITRAWHRALKRAGLPRVSFHSLRHFHASQLINAGTDILTISRRLGHAKSSITLDVYGHLIEGADAAAAKAIEGVLK
jgi:integrase